MRLLVTGFGPFPGIDVNPTASLAQALDGTRAFGVSVVGRVLDVSWSRAWNQLQGYVEASSPAGLVMLGVAPDRHTVQVERVARNRADARPDVDGALPGELSLVPDGPEALRTGLPWRALCVDGVELSDDAGRYLCNAVFYRAALRYGDRLPVGFVHVPPGHEAPATDVVRRVAAWLGRSPLSRPRPSAGRSSSRRGSPSPRG